MKIKVAGVDELIAAEGQRATSEWVELTQGTIDKFAEASGDFNPYHVDPDFARPRFGGTIAHGTWTLSLLPRLIDSVWQLDGFDFAILLGFNRVRFPAPLLVGSRVRMHLQIASARPITGGVEVCSEVTFEVEGSEKPTCVAEHVARAYLSEG